jgi:hypothetical protein
VVVSDAMCSAGPLPTRRAVLGGVLAGLAAPALAACTDLPGGPAGPPPVPPDVVAADRAADRERRLLAAYDAALLLAPELTDRLAPLRDDHAAHLRALDRPQATGEPGPAADPSASAGPGSAAGQPTPPPAAPAPAPALPQEPAALLAALADLERRAGLAHGGAAVLGGRGVGAVLACLAASEASHAVALA